MIFNDKLDASLWRVLKVDKKNRESIVDFIKGLPIELINDIQKGLQLYEIEPEKIVGLSNTYNLKSSNIKYEWRINCSKNTYDLTIIKSIEGHKSLSTGLTLSDTSNYNNIYDLFDNPNFARFSYGEKDKKILRDNITITFKDFFVASYHLMYTPIGNLVSKEEFTRDRNTQVICDVSHKFMYYIPSDINVKSLDKFKTKKLCKS